MIPYKLNIKAILTLSGVFNIIIFAVVLLATDIVDIKKLGEILLHYGLILLPFTILWFLLEKKWWCHRFIQNNRSLLNIPPDCRGRWVGYIDREGEELPHDFVIEIHQTLSRIQVNTFSKRSKSKSYFAEITTDGTEEKFVLCYLWQGNGAAIEHREIPSGIFYGFTIIELYENEDPKRLIGEYFTDRSPTQTKGKIELTWISGLLKGKFE